MAVAIAWLSAIRVLGHALEEAVEREDLWPVGILGSACFVVQGSNGGL